MTATAGTVSETITAPLSSATVAQLSEAAGDTAFLAQRRRDAFAAFEAAPMPTRKDEHWRFTKLRGIELAEIPTVVAATDVDAARERIATSLTSAVDLAGELLHVNGVTLED